MVQQQPFTALQQATTDPRLHQRLLDISGQVWVSVLWGHRSFLLGPGAHMVLSVPSKSMFLQSCVSSVSSMVGLMATSPKRAYAIPRSAAPRAPAPATVHCQPVPLQETLKHSSVSASMGSLDPGAHGFVWALWASLVGMGLILNTILPLLPSCWGFSFALGRGVSPHSRSSATQPLLQHHAATAPVPTVLLGHLCPWTGLYPHSCSSAVQLPLQCHTTVRESKKEWICMCMIDSLCYIVETNTTLNQLYSNRNEFLKNNKNEREEALFWSRGWCYFFDTRLPRAIHSSLNEPLHGVCRLISMPHLANISLISQQALCCNTQSFCLPAQHPCGELEKHTTLLAD